MKRLLNTGIALILGFGLILPMNSCIIKSKEILLTTTEISGISQTAAFSGGTFLSGDDDQVIFKGICWGTEENPVLEDRFTRDGTGNGGFKSTLEGLIPGTTYFVRAYAIGENDTIYGNEVSFKTTDFGTVTDFEGNVYRTVYIGDQTWMAENLASTRFSDGEAIPLVENEVLWGKTTKPGHCYYKNEEASFRADYGTLYNWYAVNTGKLCPEGWHVPSNEEFSILAKYLGGENVAGGKMKVPGTTFWVDPNYGAGNASGFSALPGGFRHDDGKYYDFGFSGYWWTSTEYFPSVAWFCFLYYDESILYNFNNQVRNGFSVRCVKDLGSR